MEVAAVEEWVRAQVAPVAPLELVHARWWATVWRVPLAGGAAWLKACAPAQAFEARLSAQLFARRPDVVARVLAWDEERAWLLLADAGVPIGVYGNPPEAWLQVLPRYAELQRGEAVYALDHLAHGVPDLRVETLCERYGELARARLPLADAELERLRAFESRFAELCAELAAHGLPPSVQHDDLHMSNVYDDDGHLRVLDWGDSSIGHPFWSLVVTFRFLEEVTRLPPGHPWFARLRAAYLEPWGPGHEQAFELAQTVGAFAHALAWLRQRRHLPGSEVASFERVFAVVLRRALATCE